MKPAPLFYRRRLPHWQPDSAILFVTFRLADSLPASAIQHLIEERELLLQEPLRSDEGPRDRALRIGLRMFDLTEVALTEALNVSAMPHWLKDERLARMVVGALKYWHQERYELHRYVVMPNHAHILIEPLELPKSRPPTPGEVASRWSLPKIMQGIKGYTAREGNRLLGRTGSFWQEESFDHWVRDSDEYARILHYIDQNPVAAGLCQEPADWPSSSAAEEVAQAL
jgi:REP-associated tyrosine transposase